MLKKIFWLAVILLGLLPGRLGADPVFDLGEWTVTGSRAGLKVGNSPGGLTVITARQLEALAPLDLADILKTAAGVEITSQGGLGQLSTTHLRGGFTTQTLIMMDGRPLNNPNLGTFDLSEIPAENIERIEIVRGPYSALYGPYAVDGAVNLISKKPQKQFRADWKITGGAFATGITSLELGWGNEKTSLLFLPTVKTSRGARQNSDYRAQDYFFSLEQAAGKGKIALTAGSDSSRLGLPGVQPASDFAQRNATQQLLGNDQITSPNDNSFNSSNFQNLSYRLGDFKLQFYNNAQNPKYHYERINLSQIQTEDDAASTLFNGLDANYNFHLSGENRLILGGGLENSKFGYFSQLTDAGVVETPTSYAGSRLCRFYYLEGLAGAGKLSLNAGLRYDRPSDFAAQLSPRLSALYRPDGSTSLRAAYGTAYRPPTLNDLYWPKDAFAQGNPNLQPENTSSFEAGIEKLFSERWLLRAAFFAASTRNMIMWAPTGPPGDYGSLWQPDNLNAVKKQGWELGVNYRAGKNLELELSDTVISARQFNAELTDYVTNQMQVVERLAANVPDYNLKAGLNWKFASGFRLHLEGQWMGPKVNYYSQYGSWPDTGVTYEAKTLSAYSAYGLKLEKSLKLGEREGKIYLKGENIFNAQYAESFGNSIDDNNYPMPGAGWYLGGEWKF